MHYLLNKCMNHCCPVVVHSMFLEMGKDLYNYMLLVVVSVVVAVVVKVVVVLCHNISLLPLYPIYHLRGLRCWDHMQMQPVPMKSCLNYCRLGFHSYL